MKRQFRDKSLLLEIITAVCILLILALAITGTFLLEGQVNQDWEYHTDDSDIDYYAQGSGNDFQYATSLKYAITNYFGSSLNKYFNVSSLIEPFSEKVVRAMSRARIPARKLKLIADQLDVNNLTGPFKDAQEFLEQFDSFEELENYLKTQKPVGLFTAIFSGISSLLRQSTLTEDEFATFIYEFLADNTDASYQGFLAILGEEYFLKLFSNTLYVISRVDEMSDTPYMSTATATALQQVCYQLGGTYVNIAKLSGGTATLERVLWWTWDYDTTSEKGAKAQALSDSVRGKVGDLFLVIGNLLKCATTEDIEFLVNSKSANDERTEECNKIITSIKTAKALNSAINASNNLLTKSYDSYVEFFDEYMQVSNTLSDLAYVIGEGEKDSEYEQSLVDLAKLYENTKNQMTLLLSRNYTLEELLNMDASSQEYLELKDASTFVNNVEEQSAHLLTQIFYVMVTNKIDSLSEENDA